MPAEPTGLVAVVGLLFGDEGKGKIVDALVRRTGARIVVRPGGGPQAAHHVVTDEGLVHCFSQLPAGLLVPGVRGFLGSEMLVDPLALAREAAALAAKGVADPIGRVTADPGCRLVTPYHALVGQMRELARGARRHGSCGRGVGEAVRDAAARGPEALLLRDLRDRPLLERKLLLLRAVAIDHAGQLVEEGDGAPPLLERQGRIERIDLPALAAAMTAAVAGLDLSGEEALARALEREETAVLEGAHGVLLDATRGTVPHVTATDTTFGPADRLAARAAPGRRPLRVGVLRAYATRHGAGPLTTEDPALAAALPEAHNVPNEWQGAMRCGPLDLVALRRAIETCEGVDALAVTHLDRVEGLAPLRYAARYDGSGPRPSPVLSALPAGGGAQALLEVLESPAGLALPVRAVSSGPSAGATSWPAGPWAPTRRAPSRGRGPRGSG